MCLRVDDVTARVSLRVRGLAQEASPQGLVSSSPNLLPSAFCTLQSAFGISGARQSPQGSIIMRDSFGRTINYLRISVTDLCNLRCRYCMPAGGLRKLDHRDILRFEEMEEFVRVFARLGIDKVRLTGGEPLSRKGIVALVGKLGALGTIRDLAMTTNGTLLGEFAEDLKRKGLHRVNISLDTLNEGKYARITRGGNLGAVKAGLREARRVGLSPIKLNVVLMAGFNEDEIDDFVGLTRDEPLDIRFIELMPTPGTGTHRAPQFVSNAVVLEQVPELLPVPKPDPSSTAAYYRVPGFKGRVGLISPISRKFCDTCNRLRLTADGRLKLCLHSDAEINLRDPLRGGKDISPLILDAVSRKPESHRLETGGHVRTSMVEVGG